MTKAMSFNDKKFSKMAQGLNHTWNCDGVCAGCIFEVKDEAALKLIKEYGGYSVTCGAIAIREIAKRLFVSKAQKKFLDRI